MNWYPQKNNKQQNLKTPFYNLSVQKNEIKIFSNKTKKFIFVRQCTKRFRKIAENEIKIK